ncbi:hypothetical protein DFA_00258 [Cavenderia fasciculata]|uniref:Uncharacterized protein n=1 Tax=Cavenderia fasciculata TaxID=261658 RepID=F4PY20_CACFS|nr:uncharacterized protein DFA_00258 [Cavenderia fasciculata]EGG19680.1 hypothetical protein DFA_00258 [Cavenderia fasciculata]|eukprot:XP_004357974.1 hypothetical protein DFA_00258 [Cavenderia fasciculata]
MMMMEKINLLFRSTIDLSSFKQITEFYNLNRRMVRLLLLCFGIEYLIKHRYFKALRDEVSKIDIADTLTGQLLGAEEGNTTRQILTHIYDLANNSSLVCQRLARSQLFINQLIETLHTITQERYQAIKRSGPSNQYQIDINFYPFMMNDCERRIMKIFSLVLPHCEFIKDIPIDLILEYADEYGLPTEIRIGKHLAHSIVSNYNNRDLAVYYFQHRVSSLFLKLLRNKVRNEFEVIEKAAIIMFGHVGHSQIDESNMILDKLEKEQAHLLLSTVSGSYINKIGNIVSRPIDKFIVDHGILLKQLVFRNMVSLSYGLTYGWINKGVGDGGIGDRSILSMGLMFAAAESVRVILQYQVKAIERIHPGRMMVLLDSALYIAPRCTYFFGWFNWRPYLLSKCVNIFSSHFDKHVQNAQSRLYDNMLYK